jgi:phosphoribosyl-ATP pyrophosphohydrolase
MYRESIDQFIREEEARLFVPKNGGLNTYVRGLLGEIGVIDNRTRMGRKLSVIQSRGEDIGQRVGESIAAGKRAYGLTGDDLFDEFLLRNKTGVAVLNTYDWFDEAAEFNRPALCLLTKDGNLPREGSRIAVNSKYSRTSARYIKDRLPGCRVTEYAGDVEWTVAEGTNDACIEIVYRGDKSPDSAKSRTGLKTAEVIRFSDIVLIGERQEDLFRQEYDRIGRRRESTSGSYTSQLLKDPNRIVKKLGEESAELVQAYATGRNLVGEALDVVYSTMLMLAESKVSWQSIEYELRARWK